MSRMSDETRKEIAQQAVTISNNILVNINQYLENPKYDAIREELRKVLHGLSKVTTEIRNCP